MSSINNPTAPNERKSVLLEIVSFGFLFALGWSLISVHQFIGSAGGFTLGFMVLSWAVFEEVPRFINARSWLRWLTKFLLWILVISAQVWMLSIVSDARDEFLVGKMRDDARQSAANTYRPQPHIDVVKSSLTPVDAVKSTAKPTERRPRKKAVFQDSECWKQSNAVMMVNSPGGKVQGNMFNGAGVCIDRSANAEVSSTVINMPPSKQNVPITFVGKFFHEDVPSDRFDYSYAQDVTLRSDGQSIQPVIVRILADTPPGPVKFFMRYRKGFLDAEGIDDPKEYFFKWDEPAFTAEQPIKFRIYSKQKLKILQMEFLNKVPAITE